MIDINNKMTDKMKKKKHQLLKVVAASSINQQAAINTDPDVYSDSVFKQKKPLIAQQYSQT